MSRPSWDEFFLDIAKATASRATCKRAKHGCVLVRNNGVVSTGYNGAPPRVDHCLENGCLMLNDHCERCNHAEMNAICQAAIRGHATKGCTAYVTGEPCMECIRTLLCAGITKVVYIDGGYPIKCETEANYRKMFIEQSELEIIGVKYD